MNYRVIRVRRGKNNSIIICINLSCEYSNTLFWIIKRIRRRYFYTSNIGYPYSMKSLLYIYKLIKFLECMFIRVISYWEMWMKKLVDDKEVDFFWFKLKKWLMKIIKVLEIYFVRLWYFVSIYGKIHLFLRHTFERLNLQMIKSL